MERKMLCPTCYALEKYGEKPKTVVPENPYQWNSPTVAKILERMEYLGHTINFKTHVKSFKNRKKINNSPEQWKVFENTHEAIIDQETYDIVQKIRQGKRRPTKMGEMPMFSGLLYCADCGSKLSFQAELMKNQANIILFVPLIAKAAAPARCTIFAMWW